MSSQATELIYFKDTYQFELSGARLVETGDFAEKNCKFVVLDSTIFYPQGGGQPADTGSIESEDGSTKFQVSDVRMKGNAVHHYGTFSSGDSFSSNCLVKLCVDADKRRLHAKLHSAGHLVDVAVRAVLPHLKPGKGCHFPSGAYVEYEGTVSEDDKKTAKDKISAQLATLTSQTIETLIQDASVEEIPSLCGGWMPDYLTDKEKKYRIVTVGGLGCPCGGTHVKSTTDLSGLNITGIKFPKGKMKVSYEMK